ncbi:MAG TPA: protein kinase, partial [bacterium]|nr:protein kinase [bacterium]
MHSEHGKTIGDYVVEAVVGHGGMATVYRARNRETQQLVALKTLTRAARIPATGLRREIQVLPLLNHPGVVKVFDVGEENGIPWIAMELLSGQTLRSGFSDMEDLAQFLHIMRQVCRSLSYLHGNGLIHMDIKPDNIFITEQGFPVLMDFGLIHRFAGKMGRESLDSGQIEFGTWEYMAPEILLGELPDARADLYSVGCILYEFIFGHVPFEGHTVQELLMLHRTRVPRQPIAAIPSIPVALNNLILRLLALHPSGRPGYAELVAHLLADFSDASADTRTFPELRRPHLFRSPFIARERELGQFDAALANLKAGMGGCVLLAGESGIGKTRILMEMGRIARQAGFPVLLGECQETAIPIHRNQTGASAFQGFQRPVETLVDNIREYGLEEWIHLFGEHGRVLAEQFQAMAQILPILQQPEPVELSPRAARDRLFHALQLFLLQSAQRTPLIILIDDIHWADELTVGFVHHLLRSRLLKQHPLLIVVAFRLEETREPLRELMGYPESRLIKLSAFDKEQVETMMVNMLAMTNPSSALLDLIYRHSEGNPFFLTEVLKTAVAEGFITLDPRGGWLLKHLPGETDTKSLDLSLPGSLHDVLKHRLKTIEPPASNVLAVLAVLGRESSHEYLKNVIQLPGAQLQRGLQELLFQMIIDETDRGTYRFVHEELRWSAYRRLPSEIRLDIHMNAARILERMTPPDRMMWFAEMALHCEKSRQIEKALDYYLSAGRQAIQRYVFELAAELFTRYLELAPDTLSEKVQVRLELARDVLVISGRLKRARDELNRVIAESHRKGYAHTLAAALRCLANIHWQQGDAERGWNTAQAAADAYDALQSESQHTGLLIDMACAASDAGDFIRAQTLFERCRSILEETRDNLRLGRLL